MARHRHLKNAPIREAIIHIRLPVAEDVTLGHLEELAQSIEGFGEVRSMQYPWEEDEEGLATVQATSEIDEKHVVEFSRDGFSFVRFRPYTRWEKVRDEALRLWRIYQEAVQPARVTRVVVRYINHLRLPYPLPQSLSEYILGLPEPPEGWPRKVTNFLVRQTLHDFERDLAANVTHALLDDPEEDRIGIAFDIEAFKEGKALPVSAGPLSEILEDLRALKNEIFFNGLTDRTLEMYE